MSYGSLHWGEPVSLHNNTAHNIHGMLLEVIDTPANVVLREKRMSVEPSDDFTSCQAKTKVPCCGLRDSRVVNQAYTAVLRSKLLNDVNRAIG